jgi:hypothetical protein
MRQSKNPVQVHAQGTALKRLKESYLAEMGLRTNKNIAEVQQGTGRWKHKQMNKRAIASIKLNEANGQTERER